MGLSTSPSRWEGDQGGRYLIRQLREAVWWYAEYGDGRFPTVSVFRGVRHGNFIAGEWAEMSSGDKLKSGRVRLNFRVRENEMRVTYQTGGFPDHKLAAVSGASLKLARNLH
jgi:hypothetical protein